MAGKTAASPKEKKTGSRGRKSFLALAVSGLALAVLLYTGFRLLRYGEESRQSSELNKELAGQAVKEKAAGSDAPSAISEAVLEIAVSGRDPAGTAGQFIGVYGQYNQPITSGHCRCRLAKST